MNTPTWCTVSLTMVTLLAGCSDSSAPPEQLSNATPVDTIPTRPALACPGADHTGRILVDASRDGGVWWYPQGDAGFNQGAPHQGQALASYLRSRGYVVDELPRGDVVSDTLLSTYAGVFRAGQYGTYTPGELQAYDWFLGCGRTLVLLGEFLREGGRDRLAEHLGIPLRGSAGGTVASFAEHDITAGVVAVPYITGSMIVEPAPADITLLGWLETGEAVMGVLAHPKARIFFFGDTNGLEEVPQPLVDNLIAWGFE